MPVKISVLILILALIILFAAPSYGAPCYGTKLPAKKEIFIGAQSYSIFKRPLKDDLGKVRSRQNFLLASWGVLDWLSIDLKGGTGNIKQHPAEASELEYPTFLGGGYGFRVKLYDKKNIRAVFGFQHISIHPHTIRIGGIKHKAVLDDWQFSGLVSYDFKKMAPYLGARWSRLDYIHWIDGDRKRVKSDLTKSIGIIAGFDLPLAKNLWINLEASSLDSKALAFSLNCSF